MTKSKQPKNKFFSLLLGRAGVGLLLLAALTALAAGLGLQSCNVVRTITNESKYFQKGDTTCTIVTKTIESYDASKKL